MATTPPPLPSSDEGEFDDDDDFGCFTSSSPVDAGIESDPEDGAHSFQDDLKQDDSIATENSTHSVEHSPSHKQSHSTDTDDKSCSDDHVICNGNETKTNQPGAEQDLSCAFNSVAVMHKSELKEVSEENLSSETETQSSSQNSNFSSCTGADFESNSHPTAIVPNNLSHSQEDNDSGAVHIPDSCPGEEEDFFDHDRKTSEFESSEKEVDDWADFSSALSDSTLQDENTNQLTAIGSETEPPHPSSQEGECHANENFSAIVSDEVDSQSGAPKSDVQTAVDDDVKCDISNDDQSIMHQEEDGAKSRSGITEMVENQSGTEPVNDTNEAGVNKSLDNNCSSSNETFNSTGNLNLKPTVSDKEDNEDDDDDDFGDFSDFACHKVKESSSKEDVAPISFRMSTCEDDLKEEVENVDDLGSTQGDVFDSQTGRTGASPEPYGIDAEDDGDEDWGFKAAESPREASDGEDFGDFGDGNQGSSDNANWADFGNTATSKVSTTDNFDDFNEDDFQSSASSFPTQTSNQQMSNQAGLSKVEKAISSSFPHKDQTHFFMSSTEKRTSEEADQTSNRNSQDEDILNALDSVVDMGLKALPSAKEETWTITKEIRIKDPMVGIWERLKDVNACHALDFGWNSSQCSQEVYNTLHIDTKNVLFSQKKQAVPFFASGLGILEPIRGGTSQPEKQNVPPPLLDTAKPLEPQKEPPQDIPPVDFDWSTSGLTDPLKVFKSDSFSSSLSSFEPFAEILQKSVAANQGLSEKELSPEASSILLKIPNLSFMQSKVLMFPIKDS